MKYRFFRILVLLVFLISGCTPAKKTPLPEECQLENLILGDSFFPDGATAAYDNISSPLPDGPPVSGGRDISFKGYTFVLHDVSNYEGEWFAISRYNRDRKTKFKIKKGEEPFVKPDIDFKSKEANDYYYACGSLLLGPACMMIARYGSIYTFMRMYLVEGFTEEDFGRTLEEIDRRIGKCLNK